MAGWEPSVVLWWKARPLSPMQRDSMAAPVWQALTPFPSHFVPGLERTRWKGGDSTFWAETRPAAATAKATANFIFASEIGIEEYCLRRWWWLNDNVGMVLMNRKQKRVDGRAVYIYRACVWEAMSNQHRGCETPKKKKNPPPRRPKARKHFVLTSSFCCVTYWIDSNSAIRRKSNAPVLSVLSCWQ